MMDSAERTIEAPAGSLIVSDKAKNRWQWLSTTPNTTELVRCTPDQWYLVRARDADDRPRAGAVVVRFFQAEKPIAQVTIALHPLEKDGLGWFHAPEHASHFQLELPSLANGAITARLDVFPVSERDAKCHPLASVPRWSALRPPFPIRRVIVPEVLVDLREMLPGVRVVISPPDEPFATLRDRARGDAIVVGSEWSRLRKLDFERLCELAQGSWVIVDLGSFVEIAGRSGIDISETTHASTNGIMSARVAYSDTLTRGFALLDAFPFGHFDERMRFATRAIPATKKWKQFADQHAIATVLASETPRKKDSGDVLVAAMSTGGGELIISDVPWIAALPTRFQIAPLLTRHLVRTHFGVPIPDTVQYWNRWDQTDIVMRDIGEMPKRFPGLATQRWVRSTADQAELGLALHQVGASRSLTIETGRIDLLDAHDGIPPEAMMLAMKWLAREARERTPWFQEHLVRTDVVWRFSAKGAGKYVTHFHAAACPPADQKQDVLRLRTEPSREGDVTLPVVTGFFGDGALAHQELLIDRLKAAIEAK